MTALELAQTMEAAEKHTQHLATSSSSPAQEVFHTPATSKSKSKGKNAKHTSARNQGTPLSCHRCGGLHLATVCKFKEALSYACRK